MILACVTLVLKCILSYSLHRSTYSIFFLCSSRSLQNGGQTVSVSLASFSPFRVRARAKVRVRSISFACVLRVSFHRSLCPCFSVPLVSLPVILSPHRQLWLFLCLSRSPIMADGAAFPLPKPYLPVQRATHRAAGLLRIRSSWTRGRYSGMRHGQLCAVPPFFLKKGRQMQQNKIMRKRKRKRKTSIDTRAVQHLEALCALGN